MNGREIRLATLTGGPRARGAIHGRGYAIEIGDYAADRLERSIEGTTWSVADALELATDMLPHHEAYDADLYEEMVAMAEAAGITPAAAVVVGGFTDFIDTVRARAGTSVIEDNCTAVVVEDGLAEGAGFLAQTWDMHASATEHVVMLDVRPDSGPGAVVFTTVGCLGQIGMNEAGIAVGINNLTAADGRLGVTWPLVVRKALAQTSFEAAVDAVLTAELAGGHNFLVFDADGNGVSIEAMPSATNVERLSHGTLIHTNHCLVPSTQSVEGPRPAGLQRSSEERLSQAAELLGAGPVTTDSLVAMLSDERSICRHPEPPFDYESCGAVIMRPATGDLWACWGVPSENDFEHFAVAPEGVG